MPRLLIDNFETTLGADIASTGATSLTLASGQGARLAALSLSVANFLPLVITNGTDVEVVHATARTGDVLTIVRAREGTTALTFPTGSVVGCYPTAAAFTELQFPARRGSILVTTPAAGQFQFTITDADATTARDVNIWLRPTEELDLDELDDYTVSAAALVDGTITVVVRATGYLSGTFAYTYTLS
jgi:hypothetical protein